jgi:hypothetical protein
MSDTLAKWTVTLEVQSHLKPTELAIVVHMLDGVEDVLITGSRNNRLVVIGHRTGDTNDTQAADGVGQLKGAPTTDSRFTPRTGQSHGVSGDEPAGHAEDGDEK